MIAELAHQLASARQVPDFAELWYQALTLESRSKEGSMDAYNDSPVFRRDGQRLRPDTGRRRGGIAGRWTKPAAASPTL
jgi:hypothetical protein